MQSCVGLTLPFQAEKAQPNRHCNCVTISTVCREEGQSSGKLSKSKVVSLVPDCFEQRSTWYPGALPVPRGTEIFQTKRVKMHSSRVQNFCFLSTGVVKSIWKGQVGSFNAEDIYCLLSFPDLPLMRDNWENRLWWAFECTSTSTSCCFIFISLAGKQTALWISSALCQRLLEWRASSSTRGHLIHFKNSYSF